MKRRLLAVDPATYARHPIHAPAAADPARVWAETNCYTDLLIELLHASGFEPRAALAFTLDIDFEGDQWTFFKFPHADLRTLYGWDVQELAIWRPLIHHFEEQLERRRPVLAELDAYFMPDTAGTAYRLAHVKTTVAVNEIDSGARRLGYFHNQGYYVLEGEDFDGILQTAGLVHARMLPPYVEFVKPVVGFEALRGPALLAESLRTLRRHLHEAPTANPFLAFKSRFERDLAWLTHSEDPSLFHAYSFATLRQVGACFELAETYLRWLAGQGEPELDSAVSAAAAISQGAKAYQFQLARAMARRRPLELAPLDALAEHWSRLIGTLRELYRP